MEKVERWCHLLGYLGDLQFYKRNSKVLYLIRFLVGSAEIIAIP